MPLSSHQVGSMIGGQQAMFGNFASYAHQISPGGGGGMPTYQNPMAGTEMPYAAPPVGHDYGMNIGARAVNTMGHQVLPGMATAAMIGGSFLPGMAGRAFGAMDPIGAGLMGAGAATGVGFGQAGMFSRAGWGNLASGIGNIAKGGIGNIARAGLAGIGGAATAALPVMAIGGAMRYATGQIAEGAQFQNQVQGLLQNQFRHVNPSSMSGFGFDRRQGAEVADMVRTMGHSDMMSSPQELLRVMKQGTQMGLYRSVQDVKEFKKRFKETVDTLKEVAETMNTTLEGAMPFLQAARKQGFWTPQDIQRSAQMTRSTAATTGMSVAQTQQMMAQGAQMARSIGAQGWTGAMGMQQSLNLVGGGLRAGTINSSELSEATGGLTGTNAVQALGGTLQAATTRFAASRQGRWALAALGNKNFSGFDAGASALMSSGLMGLGEIGSRARKNIARGGAFNFVMNEKNLRGQLAKQGPAAQLGFISSIIGDRLHGTSAKDQYITRRMMKRYFGVGGRQADLLAKLARDAPRIMEENRTRTGALMDQEERNREQIMDKSYEGLKRKMSSWWDQNIKDPLQKIGAEMSNGISDWWERTTDKFWGRAPRQDRFRGLTRAGTHAMQNSILGDTGTMERTFGKAGNLENLLGRSSIGDDTNRAFRHKVGLFDSMHTIAQKMTGQGEYSFVTQAEHEAGSAVLSRGIGGLDARKARTLGFGGLDEAKTAMGDAQKEMGSAEYIRGVAALRKQGLSGQQLTRRVAAEVRAGRLGGESMRALVGKEGELTTNQLQYRMGGSISAAMRGGIADIGTEARDKLLDMKGGAPTTMEGMEKRLSELKEKAIASLGESSVDMGDDFSTLGSARANTQTITEMMKNDKSGRLQGAMDLMREASEEKDPKKAASLRKKAREAFVKLAAEKDPDSAESKILMKWGDPNDPKSKQTEKDMVTMSMIGQGFNRAAASETFGRRMKRLGRSMGTDKKQLLKALDAVSAGGEGLGGRLGALMEKASAGGIVSPEEYTKLIEDVSRAGVEGDIGATGGALSILKNMGGAESLVTALEGGIRGGQAAKTLSKKGALKRLGGRGDRGRGQLKYLMEGLGASGLSDEDIKLMKAGKVDEVVERHTEGLGAEKAEGISSLLRAVGDPTKQNEIFAAARKAGATRGVAGTARRTEESALRMAQVTAKEDMGLIGKLGAPQGMHAEMMRQSRILMEIRDNSAGWGDTKGDTQGAVDKRAAGGKK